jgi:ABC-type polysaccharide/polyol phosphate export permease
VVVAYRNLFLRGDPVAGVLFIAPFALCWVVLGVGLVVFTRLERRFGDEL